MTVRAVLFDLDDTLFAYREYARAGLRSAADRLAEKTGARYHEELERMYFEEGITEGTFDRLLDRHDLSADLTQALVDAYHDATSPLSPYPETERVLSELGDRYQLGLVTDGRGGHAKLKRLDIEEYFDAVMVTPTVDATKGDPQVFETVLSTLSVPADSAVYVGDDPRFDFQVPNDLGMETIRVRRGRFADLEPDDEAQTPDLELDSLDELLGHL